MNLKKLTLGDFVSKPENGLRHFGDAPTNNLISALANNIEQRLRSEGWVPIEERMDSPA
jgi:hypothetical protein